ncbi:hypothetical protein ACQKWADRAFT_137477 [Trichoderma austrokoningii]
MEAVMDRKAFPSRAARRHIKSKRAPICGAIGRRDVNYFIRSTAKRLAESPNLAYHQFAYPANYPCINGAKKSCRKGDDPVEVPRPQRSEIEKELFQVVFSTIQPTGRDHRVPRVWPRREADEGQELARSAVALPSDAHRLMRRPSLEREEAFRVASTAKGKVLIRASPESEDAQVAELYHQGLLYDNEEQRPEEVFNLNSIQHEDPVYTIRPAKRGRKSKKGRKPAALTLSFTDLGDYSAKSSATHPSTVDDSNISQAFPPLRVVYEKGASNPSFDVETSQPPDLMMDDLSDYDCFSDGELDDDVPSQIEVLENANNSSAETWIMLG